jgi:hypothetical protein
MTPVRARPWYLLTRHFFGGFFDFGLLSEEGASSLTRMLVVTTGVMLAAGLLLARIYVARYASLGELEIPEPYRLTVLADHAFMIAVSMWLVGLVTVLVGHALFPDETDFRVLMALPVTRRLVFGTKLLALGSFSGLVIATVQLALMPLLLVTAAGRWAAHAIPVHAAAYLVSSLLGSLFALLAVVAVHGLLILFVPRRRVLTASASLRSAMLCALVMSLPLLARLPAQATAIVEGSWWVDVAPQLWFLGLECWLLGDDYGVPFGRLMLLGVTGVTIAAALATSSYATLYRRFDRVIRPPASVPEGSRRPWGWARSAVGGSRGVFLAVRSFTLVTLRRSVLHQGILVALAAAGAGLVLNSVIGAGGASWRPQDGPPPDALIDAVTRAPFVLEFVTAFAVRASLAVPFEQRANWVFRMIEQGPARGDQLEAAAGTVRLLGVFVPVGLMLPIQWTVTGTGAIPSSLVAALFGLLFVEILMRNWARIPFTCSYMPGKGFVPRTLLLGVTSFVLFTGIGTATARATAGSSSFALFLDLIVVALVFGLRWRRVRRSRLATLEFEDVLPSEVNPLRLTAD